MWLISSGGKRRKQLVSLSEAMKEPHLDEASTDETEYENEFRSCPPLSTPESPAGVCPAARPAGGAGSHTGPCRRHRYRGGLGLLRRGTVHTASRIRHDRYLRGSRTRPGPEGGRHSGWLAP